LNSPVLEAMAPVAAQAGTPVAVERRDAAELSYSAFLREYVAPNRPVVVVGAMQACIAMRDWTPSFFRERFGPRLVDIGYGQQMTFADFIDAVLASREDAPGPYMYRLFIGPHMPELLPDLEPLNNYAFPRRLASPLMPKPWRRPDGYLKLLIGGIGGRFPVMHYDGENAHATITEIYGDKAFVMYAPEDSAYLYPKPDMPNQSAIPDIRNPDFERFPLFARATQYYTVLHPGDMIFVPSRWWHTARTLSPSISICQNMLDATNWHGYVDELCSPSCGGGVLKRLAKRVYLTGLGAVLAALERPVPRHETTLKGVTARRARLAPVVYSDAGDSSTWRVSEWKVR
jgi:cupin-like protein